MPALGSLVLGDEPAAWRAAGFTVDGDVCRVGSVSVRLAGGDQPGVLGWTLGEGATGTAPEHPLGALQIDHLVLVTPSLARTTAEMEARGLDVRRVRDYDLAGAPMQQVFFRAGEVILEVVGKPGEDGAGPGTWWGITFTVADLDAAAAYLGDRCGRIKDAVQPGRRIATVRHQELGLSLATALMSPRPSGRPTT